MGTLNASKIIQILGYLEDTISALKAMGPAARSEHSLSGPLCQLEFARTDILQACVSDIAVEPVPAKDAA